MLIGVCNVFQTRLHSHPPCRRDEDLTPQPISTTGQIAPKFPWLDAQAKNAHFSVHFPLRQDMNSSLRSAQSMMNLPRSRITICAGACTFGTRLGSVHLPVSCISVKRLLWVGNNIILTNDGLKLVRVIPERRRGQNLVSRRVAFCLASNFLLSTPYLSSCICSTAFLV